MGHNYRLRWAAELKPPSIGDLLGHAIHSTLYRAPLISVIFETFNQALRIAVDRGILFKSSDKMIEFEIFGGKDFSEQFVSHFLTMDCVRKRSWEKLKDHWKMVDGKRVWYKETKKFKWFGVVNEEIIEDEDKQLVQIKADLIQMSEKWGSKFLTLIVRGTALEIWKGMILYHVTEKEASNDQARHQAINLLAIVTYCHPEIMNGNFLMTGGNMFGGV